MKNAFGIRILCVFSFLLPASMAMAQTNYAETATGTVSKATGNILKRVDAFQKLDATKRASLKKSLAAQLDVFHQTPLLNPPAGFSTRIFFGMTPANLPTISLLNTDIDINLLYLLKDATTGAVKVSKDGTSVHFMTNDIEHIFRQQGNFYEDCQKLDIPAFFEQFPVVDSTADYIELNFKTYGYSHNIPAIPIRIVKRNTKPLFVPYTRKEYLHYLIAKKNYEITDLKNSIQDVRKTIAESKETLSASYYTDETKAIVANSLKTMQGQVASVKQKIEAANKKLQYYQAILNAMTKEEAGSAAWVDETRLSKDWDYLTILLPPGNHAGTPLYKVNQDYFDKSAGASGAQLIIVYYNWAQLSVFTKDPDYLQQKTMEIFNQINYHRLKESMQ